MNIFLKDKTNPFGQCISDDKHTNMKLLKNKRLLDVKEAAEYLSISRTTIYYLVQEGRIKSVQIRTRRLFDVDDLDLYVQQLKAEQQKTVCDGT